jgi:lipid-binding SYLF domain-containing protein
MKLPNRIPMFVSILTAATVLTLASRAADDLGTQARQTVANFVNADPGLQTFIDNSAGYAVFPDVGKGGFIVGGARGKGVLFEKGVITGQTTMTQASIGAQAGGQSFAQIIFFENPGAVSDFKGGKFALGADMSAVAISRGASKSAKFRGGVAVFTQPKSGLMVQASVGGQKFSFEPLISPTGH